MLVEEKKANSDCNMNLIIPLYISKNRTFWFAADDKLPLKNVYSMTKKCWKVFSGRKKKSQIRLRKLTVSG